VGQIPLLPKKFQFARVFEEKNSKLSHTKRLKVPLEEFLATPLLEDLTFFG